jgi:7-keto-8-aminopelargonate synthetase-like enzyme
MSKTQSFIDTLQQIAKYGISKKIFHLYTDKNKKITGNTIYLEGNEVVNFGSCSYLGLEFDERLKEASKKAIDDFGTQFSESRAYVSIALYKELEDLFEKIFELPVVITQTTTLGHIAAIPVLVNSDDCIIMDHQVHNSVQIAVNLVKSQGVTVELLRHNRMDLLEERIIKLRSKYKKIWYMADGIYSMYGDVSPVKEIYALMDKYPELNYYVDDAHGMSIYGKNGKGYVLNEKPIHERAIVATSLVKAFPTGGAVFIFPNNEKKQLVRNCGSTLITSGPLQPSQLGAAIAAAKIHLTPEIYELQTSLHDNIRFANLMLKKYKLPVVAPSDAAVFFVGVSLPKLGYNMVHRMMNKGYYVNLGIFPAVPMKNTGIRFTITKLHTYAQIENMIATIASELPLAMLEDGITMTDIYKAFKIKMPYDIVLDEKVTTVIDQSISLKLTHYSSIKNVPQKEWDNIFANKGTFDWEGLQLLESSFSGHELPENNWNFDYVIINDNAGKPVVATFLTTALWKDDMQSPAIISTKVEQMRLTDPYYLTSKVISTGSLLTEGEHVYIDKSSPYWKAAMKLLFDKIYFLQEENKANNIVIRDFYNKDAALDTFLVDNGFFKMTMPENNIVKDLSWETKEDFYLSLSQRSRQHFREDVKKHEDKFEIKIETDYSEENLSYWYNLYENVKENSLDLNTYILPKKVFREMLKNEKWEVISLTVKKQFDFIGIEKPVAVVFCHKTTNTYTPLIMGLDYCYQKEFKIYKQMLFQLVLRGKALGCKSINLGFSASTEKRKVGAVQINTFGYMQAKDSFNFQVLANMEMNKTKF